MGGVHNDCMATAATEPPDDQFREIDLPPVPEYDSAEQAALDESLITAMERAEAADEATLAHVLRCEVGSLRYKATLGV